MTPYERDRLREFYDIFVARYFNVSLGNSPLDLFIEAYSEVYGEKPGQAATFHGDPQHRSDLLCMVEETRHAFASCRTSTIGASCQSMPAETDCPCLEHACLRTAKIFRNPLSPIGHGPDA